MVSQPRPGGRRQPGVAGTVDSALDAADIVTREEWHSEWMQRIHLLSDIAEGDVIFSDAIDNLLSHMLLTDYVAWCREIP